MTQQISLDALLASFRDEPEVEKVASEKEPTQSTAEPVQTAERELEDLLTKQANEVNTDMSNVEQKGKAIADAVLGLVKQAMDGNANQVISQTSAQAATSSAGIAETPRQGASITQTLQGLVSNGLAAGAVRPEALDEHLDHGGDEANTGAAGAHMTSSDGHPTMAVSQDEVEKTAALVTLVDMGVDFNSAVEMIKVAEVELQAEEGEQIKQAAVAALVNEGMDIESAVVLVKQAMELDPELVKQAASAEDDPNRAGLGRAYMTELKGGIRGTAQTIGGMVAGGGLGYMAGKSKAVRGLAHRAANAMGGKLTKQEAQMAAAGVGAVGVGSLAGAHGQLASVRNSLNAERDDVHRMYKSAAEAIEGLVGQGYSVAQALQILDNQ